MTTTSPLITQSPFSPSVVDEKTLTRRAIKTGKGDIVPRTGRQALMVDNFDSHDLNFGTGPAGTGKTFIAVAWAVERLLGGDQERLILTRPVVEAGEKLGFLPGDLKEKVDPYMQPLYDGLGQTLTAGLMKKLMDDKKVEICPLAYMRGRTFEKSIIIADEMQNSTRMQMKMLLTRLGHNSKMIITGDPRQIDLPNTLDSGLIEARRVLADVQGVGWTQFGTEDVVRHPLVKRILQAYDKQAT